MGQKQPHALQQATRTVCSDLPDNLVAADKYRSGHLNAERGLSVADARARGLVV